LYFSRFAQCSQVLGSAFGFCFIPQAFLRVRSLPAVAGVSVVNFGFVVKFAFIRFIRGPMVFDLRASRGNLRQILVVAPLRRRASVVIFALWLRLGCAPAQ
jgi:hypothetical protein